MQINSRRPLTALFHAFNFERFSKPNYARHQLAPKFSMLALILFAWSLSPVSAQDPARSEFKAGQRIFWRDRISGKWEPGTFLGETPGGKQPIIQRRPGDPGSQTAYDWENVKAAAPVAPSGPGAGKDPKPGATTQNPSVTPKTQTSNTPPPAGKPLTEEEIKRFITDRVGDKPFDDPSKLQQAKLDLDVLIKNRGTKFLYNTGLNDFGAWLSKHGFSAIGAINHNYGPPNNQNWLFGSWVTSKTGLPVHWREGDKLITWTEVGAANTGVVTINPDGTYRWYTGSAKGDIVGKWRPATVEEMGDQGGAGVILTNAKSGVDWVAFKYRASNPGEEWLGLAEVNRRSIREGAVRIPANQVGKVKGGTK